MISNYLIIGITCLVSFSAFNNERLINQLILWPPAVQRGQYYRLLTHGLIHADGAHLLFNMITLYFFGRGIAAYFDVLLGPMAYVVFYASAIVVAILPAYLSNKDNPAYRSLGASGAVSAVLFATILLSPWSTIIVWFVPMPAILYAVIYVAYSIYMDRRGTDNINHSAHLWGAAYGVAFTVVAEPRLISSFLSQIAHPHLRF